MADYNYTMGSCDTGRLMCDVCYDASITPNCTFVTWDGSGTDETTIAFDASLSAPEKTTLDGIVSAHSSAWVDPRVEMTGNLTLKREHRMVAVKSGAEGKTLTLVPANQLSAGTEVLIKDESGVLAQALAKRLTISPSGSDTIDSADDLRLMNEWAFVSFYSDGVSNYLINLRSS